VALQERLKQMTYKTYEVTVYNNGEKYWFLNGKLHREDGPAVEFADGDKAWYLNGQLHREDGPAIEWASGSKSWYLNGTEYTEAEWKAKLNPVKELSVKEISDLLGYEVRVVK
jgi:hypothetical protein